VQDLVGLVEAEVGAPVVVEPRPAEPGDVLRTGGSTRRALEVLGWSPEVTIAEGLRSQVAWHRERREDATTADGG
jgi:UDP-glucose 4-epimerase